MKYAEGGCEYWFDPPPTVAPLYDALNKKLLFKNRANIQHLGQRYATEQGIEEIMSKL